MRTVATIKALHIPTTTTTTIVLWPFVWDYPGESVPEVQVNMRRWPRTLMGPSCCVDQQQQSTLATFVTAKNLTCISMHMYIMHPLSYGQWQ